MYRGYCNRMYRAWLALSSLPPHVLRWSATVEFESSAAAALAVGCRQLIVREKAVTSEPLGLGSELAAVKGGKGVSGKRGDTGQKPPSQKKQRVG